jgi:hypothetical protein
MKALDLTGQWFGRLMPFRPTDERNGSGFIMWDCLCECGTICRVASAKIKRGHTQSCGCLYRESTGNINLSHGDTRRYKKTRLFTTWINMRQRCNNPNTSHWQHYGGRGITYCDEWEDYITFRDWALESGYDDTLCIDRIDNDGNYEPNNCQFITASENTIKRNQGR